MEDKNWRVAKTLPEAGKAYLGVSASMAASSNTMEIVPADAVWTTHVEHCAFYTKERAERVAILLEAKAEKYDPEAQHPQPCYLVTRDDVSASLVGPFACAEDALHFCAVHEIPPHHYEMMVLRQVAEYQEHLRIAALRRRWVEAVVARKTEDGFSQWVRTNI